MASNLAAICAIGVLVAAILLYGGIRALMRTLAARELAVLPVSAEQTVELNSPGEVVLALRGKLFSTAFRGVSFILRDARTGAEVPGRPVLMRSARTTLSGTVTLSVRSFAIPGAGVFVLTASGLTAPGDYADAHLVLQRAQGAAIVFRILWIIGASALLISSVVFGLLAATGVIGP